MDNLINSIRTRNIIEKYKFRFNKDLGQNFLIDDDALKSIITAADLTKDDSVLEVGPGIGALTLELSEAAGKVLTIEIDRNLSEILNDVFKDRDNIKLYMGDALRVNLREAALEYLDEPINICANLPYYITTPLIAKFFKEGIRIKNIVLMVQKEVAERMAALPGTKEYGALSLLVQYYSRPIMVSIVPPHCFVPRPKVDSMIVKLEVYNQPIVDVMDEKLFFDVIRDSFNQRRKTLSNALKATGLPRDSLKSAFDSAGIDPVRRGETLSIQEFASLSNEIYKVKQVKSGV
jgi:dimethyladenosine transferase